MQVRRRGRGRPRLLRTLCADLADIAQKLPDSVDRGIVERALLVAEDAYAELSEFIRQLQGIKSQHTAVA